MRAGRPRSQGARVGITDSEAVTLGAAAGLCGLRAIVVLHGTRRLSRTGLPTFVLHA